MSETDNPAFTSVCGPIRENKQLRLNEKICCGNNDCINVSTQCYKPNRLVACHEISSISACERRDWVNYGAEDNDGPREVCKNLDKHLCISTDSVVNDPSLNGELNWIVNRSFGDVKTELGASCQTCICCNGNGTLCDRISGKGVGCDTGCRIGNLTMLNQKCTNMFNEPIENIRVGNCSDMFKSGICQFYNIGTGNLVKVNELFFQSEVCDFTPPQVTGDNDVTRSENGTNKLTTEDKIAISLGVPGFIVTVLGVWIIWKEYKRKREKRKKKKQGNSHSKIEFNNQQLQAQSVSNVEDSETEKGTEVIPNDSHIQSLADQRNEEIEIQQIQIPPK